MICKSLYLIHSVVAVVTLAGSSFFQDDATTANTPTDPPHYRAKQILGAKVSIDNEMSVGTVDDIVLDENGNVDYLIVVNAERRLVTVPWDATAFNVEKRVATVHVTPEQFKTVPTYTVEQYPVFSTPTYRTELYKYYGLTPGQERRLMRRGGVIIKN